MMSVGYICTYIHSIASHETAVTDDVCYVHAVIPLSGHMPVLRLHLVPDKTKGACAMYR